MEFWLWMPQLFACTRARIKTQINRGLSPIILGILGVLLALFSKPNVAQLPQHADCFRA